MLRLCFALSLFYTLAVAVISTHASAADPVDQYVVREMGIGPLDAETPLDPHAVEGLLPAGLSARWESVQFPGALPHPVLRVWDGPALLFELESATPHNPVLSSIAVLSPRVADARGTRVGAFYSGLYGHKDDPACQPGFGRFSGRAVCRAPGSAHVFYVFAGPKPLESGALPASDELARWRVLAILWRAA